ncbi:MAG: hypothetical protein AMXMBFR58_08240 [Phycisphaerae bacterium]
MDGPGGADWLAVRASSVARARFMDDSERACVRVIARTGPWHKAFISICPVLGTAEHSSPCKTARARAWGEIAIRFELMRAGDLQARRNSRLKPG